MSGIKGQQTTKLTDVPERFYSGYMSDLDLRFTRARELVHRCKSLMNSLGGYENLSYQEISLCERAIFLERLIAGWEKDFVEGRTTQVDLGKLTQASNSLLGLYRALGLKRQARSMPDLHEYIAKNG